MSKNYSNLELNTCEDYGPGTKLLGSLKKITKFDYVVLIDDDHKYNNQMLKIFCGQAEISLNKCYSFCVYNILDCKVGQGADGFLINTKYINGIFKDNFDDKNQFTCENAVIKIKIPHWIK